MTTYTENKKINNWVFFHSLAMLFAALLVIIFRIPLFIPVIALASFTLLLYIHSSFLATFSPWGGVANLITLFRFLMVLALPVLDVIFGNMPVLVAGIVIVALDGVDGFAARKTNTVTKFGSHLDMETDALYIFTLTFMHWLNDITGFWLVLAGIIKYLYILIINLGGLVKYNNARTRIGPAIAVLMFIAVLFPLFTSAELYKPVLYIAYVLVMLSFAWSLIIAVKGKLDFMTSDK